MRAPDLLIETASAQQLCTFFPEFLVYAQLLRVQIPTTLRTQSGGLVVAEQISKREQADPTEGDDLNWGWSITFSFITFLFGLWNGMG